MEPNHALALSIISTLMFSKFGYTVFRIYQEGFENYYDNHFHYPDFSPKDFNTYFDALWVFAIASGVSMVVFWSLYIKLF